MGCVFAVLDLLWYSCLPHQIPARCLWSGSAAWKLWMRIALGAAAVAAAAYARAGTTLRREGFSGPKSPLNSAAECVLFAVPGL